MRTLFNILAALSLLLFLVSAGAWTRSQYADDAWEFAPLPAPNSPPGWSERMANPWPGGYRRRIVGSSRGRLVFVTYETDTPPASTGYLSPELVPAKTFSEASYGFRPYGAPVPANPTFFFVPWLEVAIPTAVAPAAWVCMWVRKGRRQRSKYHGFAVAAPQRVLPY